MKRILSILAPVLVAVSLLTVSCKSDKGPANSAEMDTYLSEAAYLNHLPDDAQLLISFHPLQLLAKSEFATAEDFADIRDQLLGEMDPATKVAALAALNNPSLAGLDPAHPMVIAMTNLEMTRNDVLADFYGVLPLTNRDLFVTLLNKADAGLTPEKDGNYRIVDRDYCLAILPDCVLFYGLIEREMSRDALSRKMDEMVAKKSLFVGSPLAESVLMGGDDLAFLLTEDTADLIMKVSSQQAGTDVVKLLGGNPLENLNSLLRVNCRRGKLVVDTKVEGSNPLYKRYAGWFGTPDKKDLALLPSYVALAGQLAFQNVPDMLDYIQDVLERSGEADGVVLADVLKAVGIEREDLNEIGTFTFGYIPNEGRNGDFLIVARAGKKIVSTVDGMVGQLGLSRNPETGYMHLTGDIYAAFQGEHAYLTTGGMISRSTGSFAEDDTIFCNMLQGNSVIADLALGFHIPHFNHALLTMDFPSATANLEVVTDDTEANAAKTLLKVVVDYLRSEVFTTESDYDFDDFDDEFDFDPDFDYLY